MKVETTTHEEVHEKMGTSPQEPAWIWNARFNPLEYLRQRALLKMRDVKCPQTELEPVPRDEMGDALIEFLNIKPTENE